MRLKEKKTKLLTEMGVVRVAIRLMDKNKQKTSKSFTIHDASVNEVFKICHEAIEKRSGGS